MKRTALLAALLALAACGDEDRTQTDYTASIDKTSTSADDTAAVPARVAPRPDTPAVPLPPQDTFAIALMPLGNATVRGSGQVAAAARSASISVTLANAVRGATYEGAVRQGVCARLGAGVASLFPVSADSLGAGRASSDVPVSIDSLTKSPHVVVYGRGGRPEACAPVRPSAPAALPPPPSAPPPTTATPGPRDTTPPPPPLPE